MANSYNMGMPYNQEQFMQYQYAQPQEMYPQIPQEYYYQNRRPSLLGGVVTSAAVGLAGGTAVTAGIDYFKNRRPVKDGKVTESFTKNVMDRIISKNYVFKGKKFFKQKLDVLKKIDSANTPKKFKKLMEKNKEFCTTLCNGISLKTMCNTVTEDNIKGKIAALKERVQASLKSEYQNINDAVKLCWDSEKKKFVQAKGVDDKLFKIIKNTKQNINWSKSFKYGGITAGILGALTFVMGLFGRGNDQ